MTIPGLHGEPPVPFDGAMSSNPHRVRWFDRRFAFAFEPEVFPSVVERLRGLMPRLAFKLDLASDEQFRGLSITAPFKEAALARASWVDEAARTVGAANTLVRDGAGWRAYNTDLTAVQRSVEAVFPLYAREPGRPVVPAAARALVLGAGGAARAVVGALRRLDMEVVVAARDLDRGRAMADSVGASAVAWDSIPEVEYHLLVNTTPVGGSGGEDGASPIPMEWIRNGCLVIDAVYRPIRTPLLAGARRAGGVAVPGAEWFVRQAEEQYERFTHQKVDDSLPRAALGGARGRRRGRRAGRTG